MPNLLTGQAGIDFNSAIEAVISRSCIIDYGIIQQIPAEGVVVVSVAVRDTEQAMMCMTCVLASITSASFSIKIKPNVGDRVLVVYPRYYNEDMFTVTEDKKTEVIVDPNASGYNLMSGIALLCNQFRTATNKNYLEVTDGNITVKNDKVTLSATQEGAIEVTNGKATVTVASDGNVTINTQGKYEIKNNATNLKDVLDGLASTISNLTTAGTSTAQSASPATKASVEAWQLNKLNTLFT